MGHASEEGFPEGVSDVSASFKTPIDWAVGGAMKEGEEP